jgi:hypothetical protein
MAIPPQQYAKVVEPCYNALQLYAVYQEDGQWSFVLSDIIQESILKALDSLCRHSFYSRLF